MIDRPTAAELLSAVKEHLEKNVIPAIGDARLRYQTLVAAHVASLVQREIELGEAAARSELASLAALGPVGGGDLPAEPRTLAEVHAEVARRTAALCAAIRQAGAASSPSVRAHVRRSVEAKLAVASPGYRSVRAARGGPTP